MTIILAIILISIPVIFFLGLILRLNELERERQKRLVAKKPASQSQETDPVLPIFPEVQMSFMSPYNNPRVDDLLDELDAVRSDLQLFRYYHVSSETIAKWERDEADLVQQIISKTKVD